MNNAQALILSLARRHAPQADAVLEVGCGRSRFLPVVASRYPAAQLTGIDNSQRAIETQSRQSEPRITYVLSAIEHTPFDDGSFDVALACKSFHHWSGKQQGLDELARLLRPGGVAVIADPFTDGPLRHEWFNRLNEAIDGGKFTHVEDFRRMCGRAGLSIVDKEFVPGSAKTMSAFVIAK